MPRWVTVGIWGFAGAILGFFFPFAAQPLFTLVCAAVGAAIGIVVLLILGPRPGS